MIPWKELQPVVSYANLLKCSSDFQFGPRYILEHQLIYVVSGKGTAVISDRKYPAVEGSLFYYGPHILHEFKADQQNPFTLIGMHFSLNGELPDKGGIRPVVIQDAEHFHYPQRDNILVIGNLQEEQLRITDHTIITSQTFVDLLLNIVAVYEKSDSISPVYARSLMLQLLVTLSSGYKLSQKKTTSLQDPVEKIRDNLNSLVDQIYDRNWLYLWSGYNEDYAARMFKERFGCSPHDYFIENKVRKAKTLLADTDISIGNIAELLQFSNIHYFSRCMKNYMGYSPLAYRKLRRTL